MARRWQSSRARSLARVMRARPRFAPTRPMNLANSWRSRPRRRGDRMMGWMAPLRHQCAKLVFSENHQEREPSMSEITTIGLDLAKHVFQVHSIDPEGTTV